MKSTTTLIAACLICLSLLVGCSSSNAGAKPPKPVKVKTVETHSSGNSVRYSASIRPATQVDVAFKVSGYIDSIAQQRDAAGRWRHLQAGDIVRKGMTLARVRQSDYAARVSEAKSQQGEARSALEANNAQLKEAIAAVETARAQVTDARANFERASLDFERAKILFSTQSITKPEYDSNKSQHEITGAKLEAAQGQLRSAEARVATARAQIGAAESRIKTAEAATVSTTIPLQDTQLKAPITAVVIERKVEVGTLVAQGTAAFVLADLSFVKAGFGVPDLALQGLKLGDVLHLTTDGVPGREFSGHISRISPSADQNSRVFEVEVSIANPDGSLKPGMIASLSVSEGAATSVEIPVVPLTAITRAKDSSNNYAVFVVEERDGKHFARPRNVTLGDSFGNAVAITSGVKPGEIVITTGAAQVADGEQVQVIP
jgi:RND family efflux transporter MFP subunit